MANKDNPNGFSVYECDYPAVPTEKGILKNATVIAGGDALIIGTDGYVDIAVAASTKIAGIAKYAATGDGSTYIRYTPALPGIKFVGQCSGTMAQTDIGEAVDLEGTTGIMEINEDANSTGVIMPVRIHPEDSVGANARLIFRFYKSHWVE